jgi:protein-arginine deiminase
VDVYRSLESGEFVPFDLGEELEAPLPYDGVVSVVGRREGSHRAVLQNVSSSGDVIDEFGVELFVYYLGLDVDADRDGIVGPNEPGKANWVWGEGQRGAVVVVNNDRDPSERFSHEQGHPELAEMIVRPTGVENASQEVELVLYATPDAARRFSVWRESDGGSLERILGKHPDSGEEPISTSPPLIHTGERCFLEAHEYPGSFFEGLLTIELHLRVRGQPIGTDRAVMRVAPWIMTPNTLPVEHVYTCDMSDSEAPNDAFLSGLREACRELEVPLMVLPTTANKGDRWIQDEVEFGYTEDVRHALPVVCDSPRDRGLDSFPELTLLGPDFGHFQVGGSTPNSLDSFGNLEVSPPVTVRGRHYPFGRVIFGGRAYGDYGVETRQMMPEVRRFLYAQKVQSPIEIFTDWLTVGHVDEILSFVPAENDKGFTVLLASPRKCQAILRGLREEGHGSAVMFKGRTRETADGPVSAEITVDELLADAEFWDANAYFQRCMDLNREILVEELDIGENDVFAVPVLFLGPKRDRTAAFYPDMVNHLVIGMTSIVPKPYGPIVDGECVFERAFRTSLPDRDIRFIDDWYSYHDLLGEVHCGTNARRSPFSQARWWEHKPDGGFDL